MAWFQIQYDQYFPGFSYLADLFHEPSGDWNNSKMYIFFLSGFFHGLWPLTGQQEIGELSSLFVSTTSILSQKFKYFLQFCMWDYHVFLAASHVINNYLWELALEGLLLI